MKRPGSHRLGHRAELAALVVLVVKGYRPLHRNWRGGGGELDLVMRHRGETVFVEVKARSGQDFGGAVAAIDAKKKKTLIRASSAYLSHFGLWESPCRFDVVTFERQSGFIPWKIRHYRNAFRPDLGRRF
jgi:putative endonuclease